MRETIHEVAVRCRRAAALDEEAARNYERLAEINPGQRDEHLSRAAESRASAAWWIAQVNARLAGKAGRHA